MTAQKFPNPAMARAQGPSNTYRFLAWSAVSAVLSTLFMVQDSPLSLRPWQPQLFEVPLGPSLAYGVVVAALLHRLATPNLGLAALHFIGTNAGWIAGYLTALTIQNGWFAIPLGGLIGAAVTLAAPSLAIKKLRDAKAWATICAVGLLAALPFSVLFGPSGLLSNQNVNPHVGFLTLFLPWQMLIVASLGHICARTNE